jgi:hypothetical protein
MFSTTLRIPNDLGDFLQEAARSSALSVNAFLTGLIEREREEARRRRLAQDWAAYGQEEQDISYTLSAQAELLDTPGQRGNKASDSIRNSKSKGRMA